MRPVVRFRSSGLAVLAMALPGSTGAGAMDPGNAVPAPSGLPAVAKAKLEPILAVVPTPSGREQIVLLHWDGKRQGLIRKLRMDIPGLGGACHLLPVAGGGIEDRRVGARPGLRIGQRSPVAGATDREKTGEENRRPTWPFT